MQGWPDQRVGELAARQHGVVSRAQLRDLGVSVTQIEHMLRRGRLVAVHRAVYAVGHLPLAPLADLMAAVLALGDGALLSHHSAAQLWELTPWRDPPAQPAVTVIGRYAGRGRPGLSVHFAASLHSDDAATRHGIPVTSPARTLHDIAPDLGTREFARAFDRALKGTSMTRHAAAQTAARLAGRPGAPRLAAAVRAELPEATGDARSQNEQALLKLIRAARLPEPELNAKIGRYTVDALWPELKLIVEVDSFPYHGTRWSFESDRARDLELEAAGYTIIRITADQLHDQPLMILARIAQRIGALGAVRA